MTLVMMLLHSLLMAPRLLGSVTMPQHQPLAVLHTVGYGIQLAELEMS